MSTAVAERDPDRPIRVVFGTKRDAREFAVMDAIFGFCFLAFVAVAAVTGVLVWLGLI